MPTRHHWSPREVDRRERVRAQGCICCRANERHGFRVCPLRVTIHHTTLGGRHGAPQLGNDHIVPICAWHHLGDCIEGKPTSAMTRAYGPSLAKGSKPFRATYGSDEELLAITNRLDRRAAA